MSRGLQNLETQSRILQRVAVFHRDKRVLGLGLRTEPDVGAAAVAQLEMARHEVGMEVRQKNMADLHAQFFGVGEVLLDVPLRIDHDCIAAGFVSQQVGSVSQATQVVLLQEHAAHIGTTR